MKRALAAAMIVAASLLTATPASATPDCAMRVSAVVWGAGDINLRSCDAFEWADWDFDGNSDEIFAVRSDRTIWHAWRGSNGWALMPGNKTADDMNNTYVDGEEAWWWSGGLTVRNLSVWVSGGTGYWCISDPGSGWTGRWRDC